VLIAELELRDITAVLDLLANADVAGYATLPGGQKAHAIGHYHLYVDRMRYHQAEDVLMVFLHGKESRPTGRDHRRAPLGATPPARRHKMADGLVKRVGMRLLNYGFAVVVVVYVVAKFFGHGRPTPLMLLLAVVIGVVGMAVVDIGIKAHYMMANRALAAKARRRREAQRKPGLCAPRTPMLDV
jgi:hypothetical protein